jgi:Ca-activated chloride channel homolog
MHEEAILKRGSVSNRGFFLRCATLTAILLIAVSTAMSQEATNANAGSLQAIDSSGNSPGNCPLKHTSVKAEVSGFISRVTVTQDFENPFTEKIEAVYTFPLPQSAAVDDLTMQIGDRTIKGKVMRKEEAQATYAAAKELGKVAALLDQKRPNIFTQAVANIVPGQQIRIVISYVENLTYEDGAYEWSFPMVIAERYNPDQSEDANGASAVERIPDIRAGHSISIDIEIDAGVPIHVLNSETHEIDIERPENRRAVVHLKDRNTIPNKDFILKYQVAGPAIDDAVLAHRSERGGFFTLILQPPQRVSVEDVRPKELVFVIDTSGSMAGFPLDKAKETLDLALNTLNPHDTFNVIAFSGDTEILFSAPQPASPENVRKAKKFLASQDGGGGTEMMKAIIAALAPSDSQQHVRIACFLTDGQVGNDQEIIAEVKKYKNARVFAMGFGYSPNRYLLDNITTYGRGEIDYIVDSRESSSVARRFNDRVRNPLLTDISVEWSPNLSITDVYPKTIPDLFSAKPVIISGRYEHGGKGTILLKGKLAGQDFVREIPIELPETEEGHDVLAALWARRKIADVMNDAANLVGYGNVKDEAREEITELGLKFKLMTQFTSFVAVDEVIFTGTEAPKRADVPAYANGAVYSTVEVTAGDNMLLTMESTVGRTVTTQTVSNLPVNGRNYQNLVTLAPGTVAGHAEQFSNGPVAIATNGQRAGSNMYMIDGVSGNFGITPGGQNPGPSASGNTVATTASGSASGSVAVESIQEITIKTWYPQPELGRVPGAQVNVVSRAGTNEYHGSTFYSFGNQSLDANDWFANNRALEKPARRLNMFGGTLGGPIKRDQLFFFGSYEGMHLRQPMTGITDVPSLFARANAVPEVQPFLNAFPLPTGAARPDGFAEFAATFDNAARHDIGSVRVDWSRDTTSLWGKYTFADSDADTRGVGGFSLNTTNRIRSQSQTITGVFINTLSPTQVLDLRGNYSRLLVTGSHALDAFGGAVVPANLTPGFGESFNFDLNSRGANLFTGSEVSNVQRQFNIIGTYQVVSGNHSYKFGADYRRMSPNLGFRTSETNVLFDGVSQAITGSPARVGFFNRDASQSPDFNNLSLFGQDEWRPSSRLSLTYGLRWELNPAPSNDGTQPLAVDHVNDPAQLTSVAAGTPLWKTTYFNFAPRVGFAYQLSGKNQPETIVRGGFGVHYDVGQERAGDVFADSVPFVSSGSVAPAIVFDPNLKLPYTLNWSVGLERELWSYRQSISASYVGTAGRRLLHTQTLFDQNPEFPFLRLTTNEGRSDYHSLQVQFNRRISDELASTISYSWAKSLDNVSQDSARHVLMTSTNPALDRGLSDFDVRHQVNGYVSYSLPSLFSKGVGNKLTRNWGLESIVNLRSAKPVNVVYMFPTPYGVAYFRPDVDAGQSLYILNPTIEGGRRINPAAFLVPQGLQQGSLGRNTLRGYPVYQVDLGLVRKFDFSESVALRFQVDAFNLFNHPNFEDPVGRDRVLGGLFSGGAFTPNATFGRSSSLLGQSLSSNDGFGSFSNTGGARTLRLSVKLIF